MLFDMLILFIMLVIICLLLSLFLLESEPMISTICILLGMIFSILVTYGLWNVEYFYVGYNASVGNTSSYIYGTDVYGDPYSYIFVLLFFIFLALFFKAGFNMWREALKTQGEIDYKKKNNRWR